jgi:hypothetical protein
MSKKDELFRKIKEAEEEKERQISEKPYDSRRMTLKMPFGCWLWLITAAIAVLYWISKVF